MNTKNLQYEHRASTIINHKNLVNGKWKFFCAALALLYTGDVTAMYAASSRKLNNLSQSSSNSSLSSSDSDSDSVISSRRSTANSRNREQNNLSQSSSNSSLSSSDSDSDSVISSRRSTANSRNREQNNLSRSSSDSNDIINDISEQNSSSNSSLSSSDSDSDSDIYIHSESDVEPIEYTINPNTSPKNVPLIHLNKMGRMVSYHSGLCVYKQTMDTKNSQDLEWIKKGDIFINLEDLKIESNLLQIVAEKYTFKKLKILEVTDSVENVEELIRALSNAPNLEELRLINTGINRKLVYIIDKLVNPNLIKKVTLQEKDLTEIPDCLLTLPNIEQITIGEKTYDQTFIKNKRYSRDINTIDKEKLIQAVKEGHLDVVKKQVKEIDLLDLRKDLSKIAVSAGQADMLKFLINSSVDVNARYEYGNTLLMEAARNNYFDVAEVLISKGANVREKNEKGKTALSLVIEDVERIISDIRWERKKTKRDKLIKKKTKLDELIKKKTGLIKMVKLLGNNGADLNEKDALGQSSLYSAIVWNDVDLVKALLSVADTKKLNNKQINELRDSIVIDVNEKVILEHGNTLLMYAIQEGRDEIVKLLLSHGANVEAKNDQGDTTLGFVASLFRDKIKPIKMLLDHSANINAKNNEGSTPLINAARRGNSKVIQVLLDHGADINAQNDKGSTPLIEALDNQATEAAILLIDKGADPFIENKKGETALSLAEQILKRQWADFIIDGAKKVIEKIKSHKGYKNH